MREGLRECSTHNPTQSRDARVDQMSPSLEQTARLQ